MSTDELSSLKTQVHTLKDALAGMSRRYAELEASCRVVEKFHTEDVRNLKASGELMSRLEAKLLKAKRVIRKLAEESHYQRCGFDCKDQECIERELAEIDKEET